MTEHAHASPEPAHTSYGWTPLALAVDADGSSVRVDVSGEIDLDSAPQLAACLGGLSKGAGAVRLDLSEVTFIDLAGLRVLLAADRDARARGARLCVTSPGSACTRLLELTQSMHLLRSD